MPISGINPSTIFNDIATRHKKDQSTADNYANGMTTQDYPSAVTPQTSSLDPAMSADTALGSSPLPPLPADDSFGNNQNSNVYANQVASETNTASGNPPPSSQINTIA